MEKLKMYLAITTLSLFPFLVYYRWNGPADVFVILMFGWLIHGIGLLAVFEKEWNKKE